MKFCKDCIHYENDLSYPLKLRQCLRGGGMEKSIVTGEAEPVAKYCIDERMDGIILSTIFEKCGLSGRFFHQKYNEFNGGK